MAKDDVTKSIRGPGSEGTDVTRITRRPDNPLAGVQKVVASTGPWSDYLQSSGQSATYAEVQESKVAELKRAFDRLDLKEGKDFNIYVSEKGKYAVTTTTETAFHTVHKCEAESASHEAKVEAGRTLRALGAWTAKEGGGGLQTATKAFKGGDASAEMSAARRALAVSGIPYTFDDTGVTVKGEDPMKALKKTTGLDFAKPEKASAHVHTFTAKPGVHNGNGHRVG